MKGVKSQRKRRLPAPTCSQALLGGGFQNSRRQDNEPAGKWCSKEDEGGEQHRDPGFLLKSQRAIKGFRKSHRYEQRKKYHQHFSTTCLGNFLFDCDYVQQEPAFNHFHGVYSPQRPTLLRNKWPSEMCRLQPDGTTCLPPVDRRRRGLFSPCCLQPEINGGSSTLSFSLEGFFHI